MAANVPPTASMLSAQVPLYINPEPLDATHHSKLGVRNTGAPFRFAAKQNFVPIHVGEFSIAALSYPIVFAGASHTPLAVMGVNFGENLFINSDGVFRAGAYVPAFIRRYPFLLARNEPAEQMAVCIDRSFELFTEDNPDVLLLEDGQPSPYTRDYIVFCNRFEMEEQKTQLIVKQLADLELFETKQTRVKMRQADGTEGESQLIAEYFAISEEKLHALSPEKLTELRDTGTLGRIYAHLVSLLGWDRLILETAALRAHASDQPTKAKARTRGSKVRPR